MSSGVLTMENKPPTPSEIEKTQPAFPPAVPPVAAAPVPPAPGAPVPPTPSALQQILIFLFGSACFAVLIVIARSDQHPSRTTWYIYLCLLSVAAGCIGAFIPGPITVKWRRVVQAGGAAAFFVLVFMYGIYVARPEQVVHGLKSRLEILGQDIFDKQSDVYVVIDDTLVKHFPPHGTMGLDFGSNVQQSKTTKVDPGSGGIEIDYDDLRPNQTIVIVAKDSSGQWWESNDLLVPGGELPMHPTDLASLRRRFGQ
jgi:hypothetical protein